MWDRKRVAGAIKRVDAMYESRTADPSRAREQYRAGAEKRAEFDYYGACRKRVTDPQQFACFFAARPARNRLRQAQANFKLLDKATLRGHLLGQFAAEDLSREPGNSSYFPGAPSTPLVQAGSLAALLTTTHANPHF